MPKPDQWRPFKSILPLSPLNYDGLIVKVVWRVRVRAVFGDQSEWTSELAFRLGDVDRGRAAQDKAAYQAQTHGEDLRPWLPNRRQ
jgi:hypothetical protein